MAMRPAAVPTSGRTYSDRLICRPGKPSKKGEPTWEFGWEDMRPDWFTNHTTEVWSRLFKKDPDGDLLIQSLVLYLEKTSKDFVEVERGLEQLHKFLGQFLAQRNGGSNPAA